MKKKDDQSSALPHPDNTSSLQQQIASNASPPTQQNAGNAGSLPGQIPGNKCLRTFSIS
jgi:hypothetical protein